MEPRGRRTSRVLRIYLTFLCYPEELKTLKTAWEHYNEGTWVANHGAASNTRTAGMEAIDREREKEWLEQMDTILIFVCLTFSPLNRIDSMCRPHYSPVS